MTLGGNHRFHLIRCIPERHCGGTSPVIDWLGGTASTTPACAENRADVWSRV
ncbi:hypothetical protein Pd630_LPD06474 [Rhodococcus opacus PD630]|nr:hypothetical protein Pd630_LPD06474 [Rhodococcus opacus PD630]